jgi:Tol biopolymer transport system component
MARNIWTGALFTLLFAVASGCGEPGSNGTEISFSPTFDVDQDGSKLVFSTVSGKLYQLKLRTGGVQELVTGPGSATNPSLSPDKKKIAFAFGELASNRSIIRILDLEHQRAIDIPCKQDYCDTAPQFSPDGETLVFARAHRLRPYSMGGMTWDDWDACVFSLSNQETRRITGEFHKQLHSPCFGPNADSVIFSSRVKRPDGSLYSTIFQAPLDGEAMVSRLFASDCSATKCATMGSSPSFSSEANALAFISDQDSKYQYEVYVVRPFDGGKPRKITSNQQQNWAPKIASNAKSIYFLTTSKTSISELWKVNVDGTSLTRVATSKLFTDPINWSEGQSSD